MVLLPLTMALLVAGTGFFTLSIATRAYELHGPGEAASDLIAQLGVQIAGISLIAALLGFSIALGVTKPVRQMVEQLEALASGDLRGTLKIASTSELDSLGGAVNDAISAIQRYYFQSMTGAVITLDADGRVIGSSPAAEATLGYREEDLVGRRFSEVFPPASGSRASLTAVETAIAGRKPVSLDDVEILAADGRPVRIGITASYLQQRTPSAPGMRPQRTDVVGVTIAFKDLNQMRSLRARLQQADQLAALGTLTAGRRARDSQPAGVVARPDRVARPRRRARGQAPQVHRHDARVDRSVESPHRGSAAVFVAEGRRHSQIDLAPWSRRPSR